VNTRVFNPCFDLLCLSTSIEFRECFTTARALFTCVFHRIVNTDPGSFARSTTESEHVVTAEQLGAANLAFRFSCVVFATGRRILFDCISSAFFAAASWAIVFAMVLFDGWISAFSASMLTGIVNAEPLRSANLTVFFCVF